MSAHTGGIEGGAMNQPLTYEIVIRGRATDRILGHLVDDFAVEQLEGGNTKLTGAVRDPAHLHGVLTHLSSFAVEIVSVGSTDQNPQDNPSINANDNKNSKSKNNKSKNNNRERHES